MGFSVSGSFAIIAVGTFIAVGIFYGAASNGAELVTESQSDAFDDRLEQQNTAINITNATWVSAGILFPTETLVFEINNTGSTALHINETDYVVENDFVTHSEVRQNGDESVLGEGADTDLWLPGETLHVEIQDSPVLSTDCPQRVKVISGPGIADSAEVTGC